MLYYKFDIYDSLSSELSYDIEAETIHLPKRYFDSQKHITILYFVEVGCDPDRIFNIIFVKN